MKFGVREICDVTFKAAANNQKVGKKVFKKYQPVFIIDTARTSNFEQASTTVYAQGGRGYARLLAWEGEKTMTFTVEDALMSPMGLAVLSGAGLINHDKSESARVHMTLEKNISTEGKITIDLDDLRGETGLDTATKFTICNCIPMYATVIGASGKAEDFLDIEDLEAAVNVEEGAPAELTVKNFVAALAGKTVIVDFYLAMNNSVQTITIGPEDFGGYYYVEAQTLFRDEATGKDLAANITFPKVKIQSGFTFTMAASGDPSTFTFTMDAFPGYTIARCDKKTMCDIQILSIASDDDDQCLDCDTTKPEFDTPSFPETLSIENSTTIPEDVVIPAGWSAEDAEKFRVNQGLVDSVIVNKDDINIKVTDVSALEQWVSSNPAQGTHAWIAVDIDTGVNDITELTYNGEPLTQADVDEAAAWGLGAGHIVLWLKGEEVTQANPKEITLDGKNIEEPLTITITVEDLA